MTVFHKLIPDGVRGFFRHAALFFAALSRAYRHESLATEARSLVYVTLLTLVPLLAVAFSLLRGFGLKGVIEPWLSDVFAPMGDAGAEVVRHLLNLVSQTGAGNLGIIGVVFLLFSVINIAQTVERALQDIWRVEGGRALKTRLSGYFTAVLLTPLLFGALMSLLPGVGNLLQQSSLLRFPLLQSLLQTIGGMLPTLLVFLLIATLYAWIPSCRVHPRAALAGAAFFLLLWWPVSKLFALFIVGSSKYSLIYSSFATIVILLLWLQFLWLLFLFGAKVATLVQYPALLKNTNRQQWDADEQYKLAALLYAAVARRFLHGETAPDAETLCREIRSTPDKTAFILKRLCKSALLAADNNSPTRYLPGKPPQGCTIGELRTALDAAPERFAAFAAQFPVWHAAEAALREQSLLADDPKT